MTARSAGILLHRPAPGSGIEVLLGHPGGPFWARKDAAAWSVPKGMYEPGEDAWAAAKREFREEVGLEVPAGEAHDLGTITGRSGKRVTVFAVAADLDITDAVSNDFEMEWPKGSGIVRSFPEIDRVQWFEMPLARVKISAGQLGFLDALATWHDRNQ